MEYFVTFLEGVITFISPCLLPMLPIYLSYLAGARETDQKSGTLINALGFITGFTASFLLMGAFAGSLGMLLSRYQKAVNLISGFLVVLFGLSYLDIIHPGFLKGRRQKNLNVREMNFFKAVVFGLVFSIGWTPCVGAFLGSALMLASQQGSAVKGILLLLCYSLGLGIPFFLSALLVGQLKSTFRWIKCHYRIINLVCGSLLIVVGISMMFGLFGRLLSLLS